MAPQTRPRRPQPQPPARSRAPRAGRPASSRDNNLARKETCIAALQSCKHGADRAETAFNELVAKHNPELDKEYQLHRADQAALRSALTKLCGKFKISYTQMHHAFSKGAGAGPPGPTPNAAATPRAAKRPCVSLAAPDWDQMVTNQPTKAEGADTYISSISLHTAEEGAILLRKQFKDVFFSIRDRFGLDF